MIIMRDSFVDGLFQGADAMRGAIQGTYDIKDRQAQREAARRVRDQMEADAAAPPPAYMPLDTQVQVGPQQAPGRIRTQPVMFDAPAATPPGQQGRADRSALTDTPAAPELQPPVEQPPLTGAARPRTEPERARRARDAWGREPQDGYGVDGMRTDPTARPAPAAGGPPPGPADGMDYGGNVPGQTPRRRPWWDWSGRAQDRYPAPYSREPAPPQPQAPVTQPSALDFSSWSDRARANYPPAGAPPAQPAPPPAPQTTGLPDLGSWSERAQRNYPSGRGAPPPAQPEPGQQGADASPTVGSRVLSVLSSLNPIGSAHAATPRSAVGAAPTPQQSAPPQEGAPAPQAAAQGAQATPQQAQQAAAAPSAPVSAGPPVAPGQAGPTVQSAPPVAYVRPPYTMQPYSWLSEKAPQDRTLVDRIAQEEGVTPARLALHWWLESGMRHSAPDGAAGEEGPLQMLPGTRQMVDPHGKLDPRKVEDALRLAARYIYRNDAIFGADTASSVVAYQGGPGTAMRFAQDPQAAARSNPRGYAYLQRAYGAQAQFTREQFPPGIDLDGDQLIRTAVQQGPDAFVQLIARSSPGRGMEDGWRAAETAMVYAALVRGDYKGAQAAREMVLHMSHQGATSSLMQAYQMLSSGNTQGAATALARAHAFVPDGQMGQFGVDKSGQLWGRMVDDRNPDKPMGDFFRVTPGDIQRLLIQTRDPNAFAKLVQEQQDHTTKQRLQAAQATYYESMPGFREERTRSAIEIADQRNRTAVEIANLKAQSAQEVAALRAAQRGEYDKHVAEVMKELGSGPGSLYEAEADPSRRAALETIHSDLRINSPRIAPGAAKAYAEGLLAGKYALLPGQGGVYGIVEPNGAVVGVLSPQAAQRVLPTLRPRGGAQAPAPRGQPSSALPRAQAE